MALFESLDDSADKAMDRGEEFIKSSEQYYKLKLFHIISTSLALFMKFAVVGGFFLIALFTLAIASSILIGNALDNVFLGYVITSSIFILVGIIIFSLKDKIQNLVIKKLSTKIFKQP